jgi:inner membrane transporter RhtA
LVLVAAIFIPWSAALVQPAFKVIGPSASSGWRFLLAALMLDVIARPKVRKFNRQQWIGVSAFGIATALMNQSFYQAIERIPLGSAVAIEFLGPFLVAALGKRSWRHFAFVVVAGIGVLAITRPGGGVTIFGALFALGAGAGWATYLFASHRIGGSTTGLEGLAVSVSIAALVSLPFTIGAGRVVSDHPYLLGRLALVGLMGVVIGFGVELEALRRLKPSIVGVLLALDPAIAFVVGYILLSERVSVSEVLGLACIVVAGAAVTRDQSRDLQTASLG